MTTNDDTLVEKMGGVYGRANPFMTNVDHYDALRSALAIARPIIEREILKEVLALLADCKGVPTKSTWAGHFQSAIEARVRALIPRDEEEKP